MATDHDRALMEAHCIPASDEYFAASPALTGGRVHRAIYESAYARAWRDLAALAVPTVEQEPDNSQLERWRSLSDALLGMDHRNMHFPTIRDAAFQLQNAYIACRDLAKLPTAQPMATEREALTSALDALQRSDKQLRHSESEVYPSSALEATNLDAMTACHAALASAPAAEPYAWLCEGPDGFMKVYKNGTYGGQAFLAFEYEKFIRLKGGTTTALYAAPQPAEPAQPAPQAGAAEVLLRDLIAHAIEVGDHTPQSFSNGVGRLADRARKLLAAHPTEQPSQDAKNARRWRWALVESPEWTYAVCKWDGCDWLPIKTEADISELDAARAALSATMEKKNGKR